MPVGTRVNEAETLLREWLRRRGAAPGERLPSERALARTLGLPHHTLNRAMTRLLAEGLVAREGYRLFGAAPRRTSDSFSCHLVLARSSVHLPSYRRLARDLGIDLTVHQWAAAEELAPLLRRLDPEQVEALILDPPFGSGARDWEEALSHLLKRGVPAICVGSLAETVPSILGDYPRALALIFRHLQALGHRELALVAPPPSTPTLGEILDTWRSLCREHGFASSARRIQMLAAPLREDSRELAARLAGEWKPVTTLVDHSLFESSVPHLLAALAARKIRIPRDLSLFCLRDSPVLRTLAPSVSVAESDTATIHETAFRMAQSLARQRRGPALASPATFQIRVQPRLILRRSTGPGPHAPTQPISRPQKKNRATLPSSHTAKALHRPYPRIARASAPRLAHLDLAPHVNRPLPFRRGWLGDLPLRNIPPGLRTIHGVPFRILGGSRRTDGGAVVFQSAINAKGNTGKLPVRLRLPLEGKVRALYFLHGCGYARFLKPFAIYRLLRGERAIAEIPLIALGSPPTAPSSELSKANIQDWWPDFPHPDFGGARAVPIDQGEPDDTGRRHAYLYTLEWAIPAIARTATHLEIEADPSQSTTLGLLAVTALRD